MKLLSRFFKKEDHIHAEKESNLGDSVSSQTNTERPGCKFCRAVITAGRSGEKEISFLDGSKVKVEIINESHVDGRGCYTLNILNDTEVGWADVPIRYCPYCARPLRRGQKKCQ